MSPDVDKWSYGFCRNWTSTVANGPRRIAARRQMMVDGEAFVGTDADAIAVAALPGSVRIVQVLTTCSVTVSVAATILPAITAGDRADIVVAVIEDGLRTEVNAGESKGRTVTHATVVHEITTVAEASSPV